MFITFDAGANDHVLVRLYNLSFMQPNIPLLRNYSYWDIRDICLICIRFIR